MHAATGEVEQQPRVDRAEREVGVGLDAAVGEHPFELGTAEVRVEHESSALTYEWKCAIGLKLVAALGGAAVLPHDCSVQGGARRAAPCNGGLALIGDTNSHRQRVETAQDVVDGFFGGLPNLERVVLDPARLREVLGELAIRRHGRTAVGEHCSGTHAGCAGIKRENADIVGGSVRSHWG